MTETIYMPVMIASPWKSPSFFYNLIDAVKEFHPPEGMSITDVYIASDRISDFITDTVLNKNHDESLANPEIIYEPYSMMGIVIKSEQSIVHTRLPWLEDQIKEFVRGYDYSVALYFFYLLDNSVFHSENIAKVFTETEIKIAEDPIEDDLSPLYEMAEFLDFFWYHHPDESIEEHFPDIIAKLLLIM